MKMSPGSLYDERLAYIETTYQPGRDEFRALDRQPDNLPAVDGDYDTYYYSAFVRTTGNDYSDPLTVRATPLDSTAGPERWRYATGASALAPPGILPGAVGSGAAVGGASGAAIGAAVSGNVEGAVVGGAVGAAAGALIPPPGRPTAPAPCPSESRRSIGPWARFRI